MEFKKKSNMYLYQGFPSTRAGRNYPLLRMSKSRTDLHLKSNIITWFSSLIIYNDCFIWIMNLASCIWSKIHGFSLKMHDLLCTALHQPMRELVCWQLTNGRLCSNINHESWILNQFKIYYFQFMNQLMIYYV